MRRYAARLPAGVVVVAVVVAVVAAVVTVGLVTPSVVGRGGAPRPAGGRAAPPGSPPTTGAAPDLLRDWDRRRARAWADADPRALAALYVRGSATGRRDVAMLAAYRDHGLRVAGMSRQVLAVRVRASTSHRLTLVVTDRLATGRVEGPGVRSALPRRGPVTRVVRMVRLADGWRVAEVGQPAR